MCVQENDEQNKHYIQWGRVGTLRAFPEEFVDRSEASTEQVLRKWSLDVANDVQYNQNYNNRCPAYGHQIDLMLACQIKIRIDQGLPCDDISLTSIVRVLIVLHVIRDIQTPLPEVLFSRGL